MKVSLDDLEQSKDGFLDFDFTDMPDGLNLSEPSHAVFRVKKIGANFIEVTGNVTAKINAVCDNCLNNFVYKVEADVNELYAENTLYEEYSAETEIKDNFFAVDLEGVREIDLTDLMYQSVILSLPNKFVCDINCNGDETIQKFVKNEFQDPRLEIFKTIKTEKDN